MHAYDAYLSRKPTTVVLSVENVLSRMYELCIAA